MTCLSKLILVVTGTDSELLSKETCNEMMCCLLKQCSEKIDHTRAHAGEIFLKLIHKENPVIPRIPEHKLLCDIFPRKDSENLNWGAAAEVFRKISQLLEIPCHQYAVLSGIILSAGGLSESLIRQAEISLENFLGRLSARRENELIDHLYKVKLCHWDIAVRELVSKALFNLTVRDPVMMAEEVLPAILPQTVGLDLHARHGSVLCAAEITHALYRYGVENNRSLEDTLGASCIGASCIGALEQIIPKGQF
ncbi:tubulin-specific chaperone D-like isoform X2 [Dendronephthya gigantea]|uniref:tubulin-specific chaperone D-like isoform X2 n=1 Tax=Dendronephthya gigantea TaxID=151771 RepID=UPI00106A01B5|nr:tubulin-specific chaperone D-like isoform X2 [Dendronephthya gigantea]